MSLRINPISSKYHQMSVQAAFDWSQIIADAKKAHGLNKEPLYLVAFRSKLKRDADVEALLAHDTRAHDAAKESPALLHYFGGRPDNEGFALSFCLWSDREAAKSLALEARHKAAIQMVRHYESYALEKYEIHHADGAISFRLHEHSGV